MLKKLALAVMILCGTATAQNTTTLEPGQIYTTGNLVNWTPPNTTAPTTSTTSPWINGVYTNTLCFYAGEPGNCGPNPTVRPGSINFSYGTTDLHQVTSVAAALPNTGTGLNVNGYNFSFSAKNGNGWDDGRQDYLMAYVRFYGPNGNTVANYDYNLNYKFDWTYFNVGKTFDTPYASKDLTAAQYGFIGRDNNYWAGNYGPEIQNVSFSLKYSVDPCATNPMFSPTCPGYLDALAKLVPASTTTTADPIATTTVSPTTTTTTVDPVTSTATATSTSTIGQPSVVAPVVSATSSTSTTSSNTATSPTSKESNSSSGSNVGLALSVISKNQERDAAGAAVAQSAVAQAQQAATQAQQEAATVAASAVANSISSNIVTGSSQLSNGTGIRATANNSSTSSLSTSSMSIANSGPSIGIIASVAPTIVQQSFEPVTSSSVIQSVTGITSSLTNTTISTQSNESYAIVPPNFLTDRTNPLTDIVEGKQMIPQNSSMSMTGPVVNKNTQDNDAAGGVKIERMATAPTGYGDYLNFTMRDVAFYAPKEVYKNQRNVDNQRALRTLTNDSKHKEMVEMQYGK